MRPEFDTRPGEGTIETSPNALDHEPPADELKLISRTVSPVWFARALLVGLTLVVGLGRPLLADQMVLKDGRQIEGSLTQLGSMAEGLNTRVSKEGVDIKPILVCDDELRRTYVPKRSVTAIHTPPPENIERFKLTQPVVRGLNRVASVGPLSMIGAFDEFGRRKVTMVTHQGDMNFIQGVTLLTPHWAKLETVNLQGKFAYQWETRLATSSIPLDQLDAILKNMVEKADPKDRERLRLAVVRFYLQSDLVRQAEQRLRELIQVNPTEAANFEPLLLKLRQMYAQRILSEIRTRRDAGQHRLAIDMLSSFPSENVAGEVLQSVSQSLGEYQQDRMQGEMLLKRIEEQLAQLKTTKYLNALRALLDELKQELSLNTLNRLAAYKQFLDDDTLTVDDKLALAASGWLIGTNDATRNLPLAVSLLEARDLVRQYVAEPISPKRDQLAEAIRNREGGTPAMIAKLIGHMKPLIEAGEPVEKEPGLFKLTIEIGPGLPAATYYVQLPPEYDPHRLYPTIVTLHSSYTSPLQQIDWWSGARAPDGVRYGQASRQGYIVIAPAWGKEHQAEYNHSPEEHAIVLNALRDAARRFAIDTDRVYLTGHGMGGDGVWDLAASHPDLWAGAIGFCAVADRFVKFYDDNASRVPLYLVMGELDGDKMIRNSTLLDKYFTNGFNLSVVEFQGRGSEHFSDEILRLFDWMSRYRRDFFPKKYTAKSLRSSDHFFWWVELSSLPSKSVVPPNVWPPAPGTIPVQTVATITATNGVHITSGAGEVTVWLAPELVDFDRPISVNVKGKQLNTGNRFIEPSVSVILDDLRTRGDRRHLFWARIDMPQGRVNAAGK